MTLVSSLLQAEVLASGAGDAAVKLWRFSRRRCVATLHGDLLSLETLCCIIFHYNCPRISWSQAQLLDNACLDTCACEGHAESLLTACHSLRSRTSHSALL